MRIFRILSVVLVIAGMLIPFASAGTTQEQIVKNNDFSQGSADWSYARYDEDYGAGMWYVKFNTGYVDIYTRTSVNGQRSWARVYQSVQIPDNKNITSGYLQVVDWEKYPYEYSHVSIFYAVMDTSGTWLWHGGASPYTSGKRTLTLGLNGIQNYTGKTLTVLYEVYVAPGGYLSNYDHTYLYSLSLYLNITTHSSGGGWGGGGSWSGGGSGWWGGGSGWFGGGGWFGHTHSANQTYVEYVANQIMNLLSLTGSIAIAILWTMVAVDFFSSNPEKKAKAKDRMFVAGIGTLIIAMAILGTWWGLAVWLVGGG